MIARSHSILLDAEALSALAEDDRRMLPWATVAHRTDSILHASTATLAEVTDGSARDANIRRAARAVRLIDVTAGIGYRAGQLRATAVRVRRKRRDLTVDAIVAATALTLPAPVVVLTSDPEDLRLLLAGTRIAVAAV
ncbi:MAG: hypothetical protein KBG85_15875 [Micropruina sp.]|nr:hypothetical protein [Micropruina sp.]